MGADPCRLRGAAARRAAAGEFIRLAADALVFIGAGHWLHVPVGKLHE